MANISLKNDTDYESDDENSQLANLQTQSSYALLVKNCGGSEFTLKTYAKIRRVKPSCKTYENIQLYVKNSSSGINFNIRNIYKITRRNERKSFHSKVYRMLLWHGTSYNSVPGILNTGFRMGTSGSYGGGIYFADRIAKSFGYSERNGNGVGYFFLAEIDLGKVYKAHHVHYKYSSPPPGFDSVKGNGSQIPTWKENRSYHGAVLPCGVTCQNKRHTQYDLSWNEYIVYDPNRIIIRFLVETTVSSICMST